MCVCVRVHMHACMHACMYMCVQGFIQDFRQEGANVAIVKLRGGGEDLIVFLGFVGEGILCNYSNKGGLRVLPQKNFDI